MSKCISRKGEFSDHETLDPLFCCLDCGAFDEEAAASYAARHTDALREIVATLGPDRICSCKSTQCGLRDEAAEALLIARRALGLE